MSQQDNPLDLLISRFGMTRLEMTLKYGFGANHLLLAAQGRKDSLGPSLLSAFDIEAAEKGIDLEGVMIDVYDADSLSEAWEQWRVEQRKGVDLGLVPDGPDWQSPWTRIVESWPSVAKLARALRVRDLVVTRYQNTGTMPSALKDALEDTGWVGRDALASEQRKFYARA
jgi:hypothetical protein